MSLDEYRKKRRFSRSPEPQGELSTPLEISSAGRFVIQKHRARNLHYDLRLEWDGVLKSWAVPKGPSLDPSVKRLAIQTEDHPLEYLHFEGVIPQGEYGAGTMMVWDTGTWEALLEDGYDSGDLKFRLLGRKLQGCWMLVHTGKKRGDKKHWLLFKERDEHARDASEFDLLTAYPHSVLSQRSLDEIATAPDVVWPHAEERDSTRRTPTIDVAEVDRIDPGSLMGAARQSMPTRPLTPMIPTATRTPPAGDDWVHEIKYDGYRMLCFKAGENIRFFSRNGNDWTDKLTHLARQIGGLAVNNAVLDGEVVALAPDGKSDFQLLQNTIANAKSRQLHFYVFDLLYADEFDLRQCRLLDRKRALQAVLPTSHPLLHYSEHIGGQGPVVFEQACKLGTEGIVSKKVNQRYVEGRTEEWLKTKCLQSTEFVVGGYTDSKAQRRGLGALVVGRFDEQGLVFEGRVGTGFREATLASLYKTLSAQHIDDSPFCNLSRDDVGRDYHWVTPNLVVQVEFGGWTTEGRLRFPSYCGLRDDIECSEVMRMPTEDTVSLQTSSKRNTAPLEFDSLEGLRLTNPDRAMYPQDGVTKLGLATYVARVAPWMLPHVTRRPLALVRCPKGCQQKCFFQKKAAEGMPNAIAQLIMKNDKGGSQDAMSIHNLAGLVALVQFSALEIHAWGCKSDRPDRPDAIVFDMDPDEALSFARVREGAAILFQLLCDVGLTSFLKTSGGKGLHVVLPIARRSTWQEVADFCDSISNVLVRSYPGRFTNSSSKRARQGKIYLDVLRNRFGATTVAAYSMRARDGATVSMPIGWDELPTLNSSTAYTVRNAHSRLENLNQDPWEDYFEVRQSITKALRQRVQKL